MISLHHNYGHLARVLHWCVDQAMTSALEQMDLTAAQGRMIGYLAHCPTAPCSRDIEEKLHLSHPTVSGILSRLEQKGFLEFRPDPQDRRCKRIYMLSKGEEYREHIHNTIVEMEQRIVQGFSPEEQAQFEVLLQRAIANMGGNPCHREHKEETIE